MKKPRKLAPVHPGVVLSEEFLKPLGLSQNALACELEISPRPVNEIVLGKCGVSADTVLRPARHLELAGLSTSRGCALPNKIYGPIIY